MLTPSIAQEIADDTSAIIGFNVLITDRNGMVIGSGHRTRVGSFHEASVEVVRTKLATSHGVEAARDLIGVKPGTTQPLVLSGETVGTVGITGFPDQVEPFGRLVRNQTEILLRESVLLSSHLFRERAVDDLVRDLTHFDPERCEPDILLRRAVAVGYDLSLPRVAVVVDAEPCAVRTLRQFFDDGQDIIGQAGETRFVLLQRRSGADLLSLCDKAFEELGPRCAIGVGGEARSVAELHDSYEDASTALHLASRLGRGRSVVHIDDLRLHELIASSAVQPRDRYVRALVGSLREKPDWPVLRQTITSWCECGFNLVRVAAELQVHRNTLIYRLNKIEELTGHSPRDARFVLQLYLACIADQIGR
ncbi:sugar diacid recognition domain-containing protein [Lentzea sp. NPDC051838]|uniref:CdaR family transcriptional regulator n=1 Tax=Lentzea sp. NPDC051838 TaxID=3154849 RepID=UPI0034177C71